MTQEWIDWSSDNCIRTPLRGGGNNYLNNNYTSNKMAAAAGMGLKAPSMMKSLQRPKGRYISTSRSLLRIQITFSSCNWHRFSVATEMNSKRNDDKPKEECVLVTGFPFHSMAGCLVSFFSFLISRIGSA